MYFFYDFSQKNPNHRTLYLTDTTIQQNNYPVDKLYHTDGRTRHPDEGTSHPNARTSHPKAKISLPATETSVPIDGMGVRGT